MSLGPQNPRIEAPERSTGVEKRLFTVLEAAEYLGLAEQTVRQWASMRKIPCVKLGTALRFDVSDLDEWIDSNRQSARDTT